MFRCGKNIYKWSLCRALKCKLGRPYKYSYFGGKAKYQFGEFTYYRPEYIPGFYIPNLHTDVSLLFEIVERNLCNPVCNFNRVR
jgi:hypothetical protein